MKKLMALAMTVVMSGLVLAGCGSSTTNADNNANDAANNEAPKKIVVGLDDNFPPMGFRDDNNELVGFDIDLAKAAAERLDMEVEFKPIDWNSKEVELNSGKIDMIWNGLTITDERKEKILFSEPYVSNRQIVVVLPDSGIETKEDLAGKVVGLQDGSSSVDAVEKEPAVLESFKELKKYPDNVAALMDLEAGRLEAVVVDEIVGRYYMSKKPDQYVILEEDFGAEDYGVGMRKDDTELQAKLQKALNEMKEDGTSAQISEKWFGEDIVK